MLLRFTLKFALLISLLFTFQLSAQNWNEILKATASDAASGDQFGVRVAMSDDTAVVSSYFDDGINNNLGNSGSVYIFVLSGNTWTQQAKLTANDASGGENFGVSVAISGNTVVVGAWKDDTPGNDSGSAYVFTRSGTTWSQQAKLVPGDLNTGELFGMSVAVLGDTVVVGCRRDDDLGTNSGSAYVYTRSGTTWTQQTKLTANDGAADDEFGVSCAISGETVVIGAWRDDTLSSNTGSAYVFTRSGNVWTQEAKLTANDAGADDIMGWSVSISGDTVIVGARQDDDLGTDSGAAYVFNRSGTTWTQESKLTATDGTAGDVFGIDVCIFGNTAIVGSFQDDVSDTNSGSAYIFRRSGSIWTEEAKLTASDGAGQDQFGRGVSIFGDTVLVGAYLNDDPSDSGSAYFYDFIPPSTPDTDPLPDLTADCELTPVAPTANGGTITATADVTFPITSQGTTVITWTYDAGGGNTFTQTQNVTIDDTTGPNLAFADPADATIDSCNPEVFVPTPVFSDPCATNQYALDFDGIDDWVTVSSTIDSFKTIEFWLYTENGIFGDEPFEYVFSWNNSNLKYIATGGFSSSYTNETISMVTNFGQIMTTFEDIPPGWNHIAFTGNGSSFDTILINGVSVPVVNNGFPQVFTATPTEMGRNATTTAGRLSGKLDEVRFWNTARTVQEITDNYQSVIDPANTDLLAYYNFEDGPGSATASDITPNSNNGTLNNMDPASDWVNDTAPVDAVVLTNDFNNTTDASGTYPLGSTTVNWTATDPSGNQSFLAQTVFIGDAEGPTITCEADITVDNDPGECSADVTVISPMVSDNCSSGFALDFDGADDFLSVPLVNLFSGLTYQAWVKTTSDASIAEYDGNSALSIIGDRTNDIWNSFGISDGQLEYHHYTGSWQEIRSPQTINDGEWHHVTVTHDQSTDVVKLFINGVEVNSAILGYGDGGGALKVAFDTIGASVIVNTDEVSPGELFEGQIDEVRVWDRALSDTEVLNSYNISLIGNEPGLVAYYDFNDGPGNGMATDLTGNGNNGSLTDMNVSEDWVDSTVLQDITLTNDFNGTADASGEYPVGVTDVVWTATDAAGNSSTCTQTITVNNVDCSTTYTFSNGVWSPEDPNGIATAVDNIIIEAGDATLNTDVTVDTVTVNPGAGLIVESGVTFNVTNGLTLESNSTSYSSLILDGSVVGTIRYERHVNINGSGSTGSNDLVSAPLTGQAFTDLAANNPNILNNGSQFLFGPFEKATGTYVNWFGTETTTLEAGRGYRTGTTDNGTITFTGIAENTTIPNNIVNAGTNNEEWNLVGNPYPSYLKVQDFLQHDLGGLTNIQLFEASTAAIYGYDGNAQNGWTIYNLANVTASTLIAPGQGFFVSANETFQDLYDLEFTSDIRSTGNSDDFIPGRLAPLTYLKLGLSSNNESSRTEFYFNQNASSGLDIGYDAEAFEDTRLYSHLVEDNEGKAIALQTFNESDLTNVSIPLGVHANQGEQLRFSISESTLPDTVHVYLEDVLTQTITLLNNSDYIVIPTSDISGTGRFFLRISEDALNTLDQALDTLNIYALPETKELIINGFTEKFTILEVYDVQGRRVLSIPLDNTALENRIDVSVLTGGVYIVNVKNDTQQKSQKVILK